MTGDNDDETVPLGRALHAVRLGKLSPYDDENEQREADDRWHESKTKAVETVVNRRRQSAIDLLRLVVGSLDAAVAASDDRLAFFKETQIDDGDERAINHALRQERDRSAEILSEVEFMSEV